MSVLRQLNVLGQQRLDVPHIRSIESSIAADFDVVCGRVSAGAKAVVIRGFTLANYTAGTSATSVQLSTADGIVYNINSSESGTFLWVPADRAIETLNSATNARVQGGFTAGQTNYVGIDLVRTADDSTSDLVQFLDPNTLLEQPKSVPLARTLDYRIVISTTPFSASPNIIPIAKILTDAQNQISSASNSVQDARNGLYRLGTGGDFPSTYASFTWPQNRLEYDPNVGALSALDHFSGGDKGLRSQKDWMDAVMTRLWELGGGQNWYSPTTGVSNVKLVKDPGVTFVSNGDNFEWGAEGGVLALGLYGVKHLHWRGLKVIFENANVSGIYYNAVQDQPSDDPAGSVATSKTALEVGDCIYVDLDRTSNATVIAKKAKIQTLGSPTIPGSRVVLAWRDTLDYIFYRDGQHAVNQSFVAATTVAIGAVRLSYVAGTPGTPTLPPLDANNSITIGGVGYTIIGNNPALILTGGGTGPGINSTGGASSGAGGTFTGGGPNGRGVNANGVGTGHALVAAAAGSGTGALITSSTGIGTDTTGGANQPGLKATGGTGNSDAVQAAAVGTGKAFKATLGDTEIPATNKYTFATARSRSLHIPASSFDLNGTWVNGIDQADVRRMSSNLGKYRNESIAVTGRHLGQTARVSARSDFHLPHGASITSMHVLYGGFGGANPSPSNTAALGTLDIYRKVWTGSAITMTKLNTTSGFTITAGGSPVESVSEQSLSISHTVDNTDATYEALLDMTAMYNWYNENTQNTMLANAGSGGAACSVLKDGRVMITGGQGGGGATTDSYIYEPMSGLLTAVTAMNSSRSHHHQFTLSNGKVLVIGGNSDSGNIVGRASAEVYDPETNAWTTCSGTLGNPLRFKSIMHPRGDGVYCLGGADAANASVPRKLSYVNETNVFTLTDSNADRSGCALAFYTPGGVNNTIRLAAIGGGSSYTSSSSTWSSYNPDTDTWAAGTNNLGTSHTQGWAWTTPGGNIMFVSFDGATTTKAYAGVSGADNTMTWTARNDLPYDVNGDICFQLPNGDMYLVPSSSGFRGVRVNTRETAVSAPTGNLNWITMGDWNSEEFGFIRASKYIQPWSDACMLPNGEIITVDGRDVWHFDPFSNTQNIARMKPTLRFFGLRINYNYTEVNPEM